MQFRQDTLAELIRKVGYLMLRDKFLYDQVLADPAPSASTFALQKAKKFPAGHYDGMIAYLVAGTGSGQESFVDDSATGTGVITVSPSLSTTPDSTTYVEFWPADLPRDAVAAAINLALDDLGDVLDVYVETASPTIDSDRRVITIPDTYVKLVDVKYRDSGGAWKVYRYSHNPDLPKQEQGMDFTVQGRSIYLSEELPDSALEYKISGYRLPAEMTSDSSLAEAPAPYLVYKAAANLEQSLAGSVDVDPENHATRGGTWLAQAQLHRPAGSYANYLPNTIVLDVGV